MPTTDEIIRQWNDILEKMGLELEPSEPIEGATVILRYRKGSDRSTISAFIALLSQLLATNRP